MRFVVGGRHTRVDRWKKSRGGTLTLIGSDWDRENTVMDDIEALEVQQINARVNKSTKVSSA
jgi:hypothetical protein